MCNYKYIYFVCIVIYVHNEPLAPPPANERPWATTLVSCMHWPWSGSVDAARIEHNVKNIMRTLNVWKHESQENCSFLMENATMQWARQWPTGQRRKQKFLDRHKRRANGGRQFIFNNSTVHHTCNTSIVRQHVPLECFIFTRGVKPTILWFHCYYYCAFRI